MSNEDYERGYRQGHRDGFEEGYKLGEKNKDLPGRPHPFPRRSNGDLIIS